MQQKTINSSNINRGFLNKKQLILIGICVLAAMGFLAYTFAVFKWDFFIQTLAKSFENQISIWLFVGLVSFGVIKLLYYIPFFLIRLHELQIKCTGWEWVKFSIICTFIASVTPTSAGSEPYVLYFLTKKGMPVNQATALVFSNGFFTQLCLFLISLPVYIMSIPLFSNMIKFNAQSGISSVLLLNIGMIMMIVVLAFYFSLCFSKKIHYYLSRIWNRSKKLFKMPYHTKEETKKTYLEEQRLRWYFVNFIKKWKGTFLIILWILVFNFAQFALMGVSALTISSDKFNSFNNQFNQSMWSIILLSTMLAVPANSYIPMPGGEGSLQLIFSNCVRGFAFDYLNDSNKEEFEKFSSAFTFLWRSSTFYFSIIFSSLILGVIGISGGAKKAKHRVKNKTNVAATI